MKLTEDGLLKTEDNQMVIGQQNVKKVSGKQPRKATLFRSLVEGLGQNVKAISPGTKSRGSAAYCTDGRNVCGRSTTDTVIGTVIRETERPKICRSPQ
ncbi:unnamed protein product [Soboliphyme baturini]|uniref:Transposase n=1 Tax=Soboliphyme baturini TaxID=241478 RepID=A0A183IZA4_9BILA|nr:unnamed protein product [Soboliphyme baturini]